MNDARTRAQPAGKSSAVTDYFTGLAAGYAEFRPTYPRQAIASILEGLPGGSRVADIGCGTGISTRLLAEAGAVVIGIDPNEDMLAQARHEHGSIEYHRGTGERTSLSDASVDVVVCAQSFHWFDDRAALKEFHRILRPNPGRLALMWNVRDDSEAFTARYGEVVQRAQDHARSEGRIVRQDHHGDPSAGGWFSLLGVRTFVNSQRMNLDGLLGRARSASYFPRSGPVRDEFEETLRRDFEIHQRDGVVTLLYRTEVTFAQRVA